MLAGKDDSRKQTGIGTYPESGEVGTFVNAYCCSGDWFLGRGAYWKTGEDSDEDSDEYVRLRRAPTLPGLCSVSVSFFSFLSAPAPDLPTNTTKQSPGPFCDDAFLDCYFLAVCISVQEISGILTDPVCVTAFFFPSSFPSQSVSQSINPVDPSVPGQTL